MSTGKYTCLPKYTRINQFAIPKLSEILLKNKQLLYAYSFIFCIYVGLCD